MSIMNYDEKNDQESGLHKLILAGNSKYCQ